MQPITDPRYDWEHFFAEFLPAYQADFLRAISEIHAAAASDPYARIGGYRLIAEFDGAIKDPLYLDLMDALLDMMFDHGLGTFYMTGYEADRWFATRRDDRR